MLPAPEKSVGTVWLRNSRHHPSVFRKMVQDVSAGLGPGDFVEVRGPANDLLGYGFYNPLAEMPVRLLGGKELGRSEEYLEQQLGRAVDLRVRRLNLPASTTAYRVIHAEADGWPGLVIDRYGDVLSAEAFSLAMYQRGEDLLRRLTRRLGTTHWLLQAPDKTHGQEGFQGPPLRSAELPQKTVIEEFGTRFQVDFGVGHKTGFFCDQRENRQRLTRLTAGQSVLDLCCYTGGFAIQAARLGSAASVTAVDLDETALEVARTNARLNGVSVRFVHVDVFQYLRDLIAGDRRFDVVILDPPKLIRNRSEIDAGTRKHLDLNRLAMQVVADGGLLITCSCSGLLTTPEFLKLLRTASYQAERSVQVLDRTGAAGDHPVHLDVPETEYLQAAWLRINHK
ncbi:MAG: class I SAM-dependent rRNA methyltransferase [Planctomycetaceae bacterium]